MTIDELADQELVEASDRLMKTLQNKANQAKESAYFDICIQEVLKSRQIRPELISELVKEVKFARRTGSLNGFEFYGKYRQNLEIREVGKVVFTAYRKHANLPTRTLNLTPQSEIAQDLLSDFKVLNLI